MIGIVGGMGPLAGLDVFKKIIEQTPGATDQDHASVLLFSQPSEVPDRTRFLLGEEKTNPAHAISEILRKLEIAGATVVGIPCNTAHTPEILEVISKDLSARSSKMELVHLIDATVAHIRENFPGVKVGILSTTGTRKTGLYRNACEQAGLEVLEPDDAWQERIHAAVYDRSYGIKARSFPISQQAVSDLEAAIAYLKEKGAEAILLGCTEIPLVFTETEINNLPLIDPNRILANKLLERVHSMGSKQNK